MIASLLVPLVLAAADPPAVPVAMVLKADGPITLVRGGKNSVLEGACLLLPGDRIEPGANVEAVVVFFHDGHREKLKAKAVAVVGARQCQGPDVEREAVAITPPLPRMRQLEEHLKGLNQAGQAHAGTTGRNPALGAAPRVSPIDNARVVTDHPTLSWKERPGARAYQITLSGSKVGKPEVQLWTVTSAGTRLPYPEDKMCLDWGATYRWRVVALLDGNKTEEVARSTFFTPGQPLWPDLPRLELLSQSEDPADWLLAAALYESLGVHDRALGLWEKLAGKFPQAVTYQQVLANYYDSAGRPADADRARQQAKDIQKKRSN
jgi:hypothetical protein